MSATSNLDHAACAAFSRTSIRSRPPRGIAWRALMIRLSSTCSIWAGTTGACGRPWNFFSTWMRCLLRSFSVRTSTSSTRATRSVVSRWVEVLRAKPSMLLMMVAARWLPLRIFSRAWRARRLVVRRLQGRAGRN